ncbi:MAG TPA: PadR family transcriptional regulator [Acidimicrobiia bacterium]
MLELAILGLLKEQPLHGYELKKRLGETLGFLWGVSYGSLYPALKRLERDGAIETVDPAEAFRASGPATGSLSGEAAAARIRRLTKPGRRTRKAYRITPAGEEQFTRLLIAGAPAGADEDRDFTLKFAFARHLSSDGRLELLGRRRVALADRLSRARSTGAAKGDRYTRSLAEHRTKSTERDLEWVDELISAERRASTAATPASTPPPEAATVASEGAPA